MTTYRFKARRVPSNASRRRRGIGGELNLAALMVLAGSKQPAPDGAPVQPGSGQVIPRIGGGYVR
jgi:hypothetical protein